MGLKASKPRNEAGKFGGGKNVDEVVFEVVDGIGGLGVPEDEVEFFGRMTGEGGDGVEAGIGGRKGNIDDVDPTGGGGGGG